MARVQSEIQQILARLTDVYIRHTLPGRVFPCRPSGQDNAQFQQDMNRLLILRGITREGEIAHVDMWELFLEEFGPRMRASKPSRRSGSPYPGAALRHPHHPTSAALNAVVAADSIHMNGTAGGECCRQNQQSNSSASPSATASVPLPGRHVRFQSPLPRPQQMGL
ncbi:hypothetical protein MAP00_002510 [Monascus purpureus]|nr:hypothetical protein MAP00_002510 [Monascus purpureus]